MKLTRCLPLLLALTLLRTGVHADPTHSAPPLANAVILIIRHAEKPDSGPGLTPTGRQRALAYARYFQTYQINAQPLRVDYLIAAADTQKSHRPRLTLEPLSSVLRLPIEDQFPDKEVGALVAALQSHPGGKHILICWHHKEIPPLLQALGADPATLLPKGKWPDTEYGWVIQLPYDPEGHLIVGQARRITEPLFVP